MSQARGADGDAATVTVYEDGPLIVRGRFTIAAQDGAPIPAGRRTVALCRCGRSALKPFCDGSHQRTGFRAPGGAQRARPAAVGGGAGGGEERTGDFVPGQAAARIPGGDHSDD
jgi:CDGSH-type Zn-finger protein